MLFVRSAISATGGVAAVSSGTVDGTNWAQGYVSGKPLVSNAAITAADEFNAGFAYTNGRALRVRDCTAGGVPAGSTRGYNGIAVDSTGRACYSTVANPYSGTNYIYLPGVASNYASTPDSVPVSVLGDIAVIALVALNDWEGGLQPIVANLDAGALNGYRLVITSATKLVRLDWGTGAAFLGSSSTVSPTVSNFGFLWVAATMDVDDGGGNRVLKFFTAAASDSIPTSWTQLGATVTTAATTVIGDSAETLNVGYSSGGGQLMTGKVRQAAVFNGIPVILGGAASNLPIFHANFSSVREGATTFTESSSNAATVTINGTQAYVYSPVMVGGMAVAGDGRFFMTVA